MAAGIACGAAFDLHYRVIHPDGSIHHVASRARLVTDAAGRPLQLVGTTRDVTAERVSAARQAFLLQLADALRPLSDPTAIQAAAMYVLGAYLQVDRVLYADIAADDTYVIADNYVRDWTPLIGRFPVRDCGQASRTLRTGQPLLVTDVRTDPTLDAPAKAAFTALGIAALLAVPLVKADRWVVNLVIHHRTARQWSADDLWALTETAERTWAAVERARAEAALRTSEAQYRTLFTAIDEGFCIIERVATDPLDFRYRAANPAFARHTGVPDVVGKTIRAAFPDAPEAGYQLYAQVLATGAPIRVELDVASIERVLDLYAFPIGAADEHTLAVLFTDITARKQAEAAVARALAAEHAARATAEAALATRDQFLAIATHELRTPLTGLVGYAELLQRKGQAGRLDAAAAQRIADVVVRQARQLNRLVEQLFDVSRIARGYLALERRPLDLGALVAQVTEEVRLDLTDETQHRIAVTRPPEPLRVDGDAARLEQVIRNLLSNAVKYSPHGGPIHINVARQGTEVALAVTDTGIGIPAEARAQLFESFYRARNVGSIQGFGIGLHVVHAIVERHGGRMEVESVEGQGSTFRVILPLVAAPA